MDPEPRHIETSVHGSSGVQAGNNNIQINNESRKTLDLGLIGRAAPWKVVRELRQLDVDDADQIMKAAPEKDADEVLRLLYSVDEEYAVALVAVMHPARARALISRGGPDLQGLADVPAAAEAMSRVHDKWGEVLGAKPDFLRRTQLSPQGTDGFYIMYRDGAVFWSARGGAHPTTDPIADLYLESGGSEGPLGFPLTPPTDFEVGAEAGTRQHFEFLGNYSAETCSRLGVVCGATVYRSEKHGTFATWGGIGEHYESHRSVERFGFPTGPEQEAGPTRKNGTGDHGWIQPFERGSIAFTESVGAIEIMSPVRELYDVLGGVNGRLGFPRGKSHAAGRSPQGTDGRFQRFEGAWDYPDDLVAACIGFDHPGGATVYTSTHGTHTVDAGIGILYERLGGTASWLGFPTDAPRKADARRRIQPFEGGAIYWSPEHDSIAVREDVLAILGPDIGFPTHPEQTIGDGPDTVQFFEAGLVTRRSAGIARWHQ